MYAVAVGLLQDKNLFSRQNSLCLANARYPAPARIIAVRAAAAGSGGGGRGVVAAVVVVVAAVEQ